MKIKDETYRRVRASLCDIHGLGGRTGRKQGGKYGRDTTAALDDYAAQVTATIHNQRRLSERAA